MYCFPSLNYFQNGPEVLEFTTLRDGFSLTRLETTKRVAHLSCNRFKPGLILDADVQYSMSTSTISQTQLME